MTPQKGLLVVGKLRPERKRSLNGMAVAANLTPTMLEDSAAALSWLDANEPGCLLVDGSVPRLDKVIGKLRSNAKLSQVPVLALVQSPDDLWVEQYFGWGGDDIVHMDAGATLLERLKSASRELPKGSVSRGVVIAEPDRARADALARVFLQAGFEVRSVTDRTSLESTLKQDEPQVVVANALIGELPDLICRHRGARKQAGWIVLSARRDLEATQVALASQSRCSVLGVQSSPWQILYRANEVSYREDLSRRAESRRYVGSHVLFRTAGGDEDDVGVCYNISSRGMYIRTFAPLQSEQVWIEWRLPHEKTRLRLEGRVAWRHGVPTPTTAPSAPLGFGVEFVDWLGAGRTQLERALDALDGAIRRSVSPSPFPGAGSSSVQSPNQPSAMRNLAAEMTEDGVETKLQDAKSLSSPKVDAVDLGASAKPIRVPSSGPPRPAGYVSANASKSETSGESEAKSSLAGGPTRRDAGAVESLLDVSESAGGDSTDVVKRPYFAGESGEMRSERPFFPDSETAILRPESSRRSAGIGSLPRHIDDTTERRALQEVLTSLGGTDEVRTDRFEPEFALDVRPARGSKRRAMMIGACVVLLAAGGALAAYLLIEQQRRERAVLPSLPEPRALPIHNHPGPSVPAASSVETTPSSPQELAINADDAVVLPDPGGDIPGYPLVQEAQLGKGRLLADRYGYLVVRFPEPAFIFSENIAIGPVNAKIAVPCGEKTLRVGVGEKPTTYLSGPGKVNVVCRETTRVIIRKLPGVVAPAGALRPLPVGAGASARPEKEKPSVDEMDIGASESATPTPAPREAPVNTQPMPEESVKPSEKAAVSEEAVVNSRE